MFVAMDGVTLFSHKWDNCLCNPNALHAAAPFTIPSPPVPFIQVFQARYQKARHYARMAMGKVRIYI